MPGDGIGPEIVASTLQVLRRADARFGLGLAFEEHEIGFASLEQHGTTLRPHVLEAFDAAVDALLADPARRTRDLGGPLGSQAFTDALCAQLG